MIRNNINKILKELDIPKKEIEKLKNNFFKNFPQTKEYIEYLNKKVKNAE